MNTPAIEINEIFSLAYRFVTETDETIFLTGKAGTGKTTFLRYIQSQSTKASVIAAPTGVAAIHAGGVTLHSLFQLPLHPFIPTEINRKQLVEKAHFNKERLRLLRKMEVLIIDEISMVRADTLDAVDMLLRYVRRNASPFGGVQLLCIGDLHQLPPVAKNDEWEVMKEYYSSPFFFESRGIKELMPLLIELDKIYRQKESSFVDLLNKVRDNVMSDDDFVILNERYRPHFAPPLEEKYITLTTHNQQAQNMNARRMELLISSPRTYRANVEDNFPENSFPVEANLTLKVGAQVMFVKNDFTQKKYFNGKIGVVSKLEPDAITVESDGVDIVVQKETWENIRYTVTGDGALKQELQGTFTQYPLRLAWAITIHKSQGLTFEKVMLDAAAAFSSGQVYVALSRCTSLSGIVLLAPIPPTAIKSNEEVKNAHQLLRHKGSLAERFLGARKIFIFRLLSELFSFSSVERELKILNKKISEQQTHLNAESTEWMLENRNKFIELKKVGDKFINHIQKELETEPEIEKNEPLKKRLQDASAYFTPLLADLLQRIHYHPLITESKETAKEINDALMPAAHTLHLCHYEMNFYQKPFSLTAFLQYKLEYKEPRFFITCYASQRGTSDKQENQEDSALFDELKKWRDEVVEKTGKPIYMVADRKTLEALSTYRPFRLTELYQVGGFGKAKVEAYGETIIDIIKNYCEQNGLESNMGAKGVSLTKPKKKKVPTATLR